MLNLNKKPGDALTASEINQMGGGIDALEVDVNGIKKQGSLYDLFKAIGAVLNKDGNTWTMNEVADLTAEDMTKIILNQTRLYSGEIFTETPDNGLRTNYLVSTAQWTGLNLFNMFNTCRKIETIRLQKDGVTVNTVARMEKTFAYCYKLRKILNPLNVELTKSFNAAFLHCFELQDILLIKLPVSINFEDSNKLSKQSVLYMIQNADPSSAITITLHPKVYTMALSDSEIQAALDKQPLVSLAEGNPKFN